jgi:hypothetical protein
VAWEALNCGRCLVVPLEKIRRYDEENQLLSCTEEEEDAGLVCFIFSTEMKLTEGIGWHGTMSVAAILIWY